MLLVPDGATVLPLVNTQLFPSDGGEINSGPASM